MKITPELIRLAPKTDLHLHLDGSLRIGTLIELAKEAKVKLPAYTESGLLETVFKEHYADLPEYLQGFRYTVGVLQTEENLERVAYELAQDNIAEGVRYIEVRFAPQLHMHDDLTISRVLHAVNRGLNRAKEEFNRAAGTDIPFEYGIIACAMRRFNKFMSPYFANLLGVMKHAKEKEIFAAASLELVRAAISLIREDGLPIVGFDLAGEEAGYPAIVHREAFQQAHRHFLKATVHAGEAYGPESIFQAITECYAKRIGHGTFLFAADKIRDERIANPQQYVNNLVDFIASQRIALEVCPTSNLQTIPVMENNLANHSLRRMLQEELAVTICTDNRLVSRTNVCKELQLVSDTFNLSKKQFRDIILAGFKGGFFPGPYKQKREYVRQVIGKLDGLLDSQG
ncbi:adenosine deaminase [Verrucomicrobiota bacterium]